MIQSVYEIEQFRRKEKCWVCPECDTENGLMADQCLLCGHNRNSLDMVLEEWKESLPVTPKPPIYLSGEEPQYEMPRMESKKDKEISWALWCLFIAIIICIILLCTSIANGLNSNHTITGIFEAEDKKVSNSIQNYDFFWDDENTVDLLNWRVPIKVLNGTIHNCEKFELDFEISNIQDGNPYGEWYIYIRNLENEWIQVSSFVISKENNPKTVAVLAPNGVFVDFNAISLARNSDTSSNHSYNFKPHSFSIVNE